MIDLKEQIRKTSWHFFHRRSRSPFYHLVLLGASLQRPGIPFDHRIKHFGVFFDNVAIDESEKSRLRDVVIKRLQKRPDFLLKLMEQGHQEHETYVKKWKKHQEYAPMSNEELAKALTGYVHDLLSFGIYVPLPLFVEDYLEQTLLTAFTKRFGKDAQNWFSVAVDPVKDGSVLQEEIALLKLAEKASVTDKELEAHRNSFCWMKNVGYFEDYYDVDYYRKRLEEFRKTPHKRKEIEEQRKHHRTQFDKLLKLLADDQYLVSMTRTANEAVFFRSYRTEIFYSSSKYFTPLFKEIAKRIKVTPYQDILWLYWDEIRDMLKAATAASTALIETRKKGYVLFCGPDGSSWRWEGKEGKEMFEAYQSAVSKVPENAAEVKGSPAFPGKITGKAVVVTSPDQLGKVQQDDILIAHATNVNYVPALKKVSAMVTEEGGILSHAAIISREMRIPCVIGTKIATKVFKDGDMVEVDAEKGTVKKVKK